MTHEYTLLLGATILPGGDRPACEAIAWAGDTVLAVGSEAEVLAISRGDSHVMRHPGAWVVPLRGLLEVGGPADLAVLARDPREGAGGDAIAMVRGGRRELHAPSDALPLGPAERE